MNLPSLTEAVARAIFDKLIVGDGPWSYAHGDTPDNITLDGQFDCTELAQAAIQTIIAGLIKAGVSEAMMQSGLEYIDLNGPGATVQGIYLVCLRRLAVDLGLELGK